MSTVTSLKFDITSQFDSKGVDDAQAKIKTLKTQLDELTSKKLEIQADTSDTNLKIAETKRQIDEIRNVTLRFNPDDALALGTIDRLKEKLAGLQEEKINLRIDSLAAQAEIDKVKLELDELKASSAKVKLDVDDAGLRQKLAADKQAVDDATKSMQGSFQNAGSAGRKAMLNLASGLFLLLPAIVPLSAATLGLGGALVSAFLGAGLAAGVFGLALGSTLKSAMTVATNANQLNQQLSAQRQVLATLTPGSAAYKSQLQQINQTQAQLNTTMSAQGPMVRQVALAIMGLQDQWKRTQQAMQGALSPYINSIILAISQSMKAMVPIVEAVSRALEPLREKFNEFFVAANNKDLGSGLQNLVNWVIKVGVPDLVSFVNILIHLGITIGQIARAFSSQGKSVLDWLSRITAELDRWGSGGGFERFAASVQQQMPEIREALGSLGQAIQKIIVALAQMGPTSLSTMAILLDLLARLPVGAVQAFFVAFAGYKAIAATTAAVEGAVGAVKAIGVAYKTAQLAIDGYRLAQAGANITAKDGAAAMVGSRIATLANAAATGVQTAATWLFDAAETTADVTTGMFVATIGLIVVAVAAIGVGIYELATHWNTVWGAIKKAFVSAWDGIKIAFDAVVSFIRGKWGAFVIALPVVGWLIYIAANWQRIWGDIKKYFADAINGIKSAWDTVSGALKTAWDTVWSALKTAALTVWSALKTAWNDVVNGLKMAWDTVSGALKNTWNDVWNAIKVAAQFVWDVLKAAWNVFLSSIKSIWDTVSSALKTAWNDVWNTIKLLVQPIWDGLKTAWNTLVTAIRTIWDTASSILKTAWNDFWNTIRAIAQPIWDGIKSAFNAVRDSIVAAFQFVVDHAKTIWGTIVSIFESPVNVIIRVWNDIAGVLGLPKLSSIGGSGSSGSLTGAAATSQSSAGTSAGNTAGRAYATGGRITGPGTGTSDSIPIWASHGEFMMPADTVQHYGLNAMEDIRAKRYANGGYVSHDGAPKFGIGGFISSVVSGVGDLVSGAVNAIDSIPGVGSVTKALTNLVSTAVYDTAKPIITGIENMVPSEVLPIPGAASEAPHGFVKHIGDSILDRLKQEQAKAQAAAKALGGSIPTGTRKTLIDQALLRVGIPQSQWPTWEAGLNTLITRESGWSPNAINLTDSNAKAGHPSQGLMQLIPSTFAAYGMGGNINDPLSNIVAGIRYIIATYGGIQNVQQANANLAPKGYDMGGPLMPGFTLAHNTTGAVEGVLNPTGLSAIGGLGALAALNSGAASLTAAAPPSAAGAGGGAAVITLNMPITVSAPNANAQEVVDQVEAQVLPKIYMALEQGVGHQ